MMNINNVAIVRATNIIPYDGIVKPISEVPYLKLDTDTNFAYLLIDLLREKGILPPTPFRLTKEYIDETETIARQYLPYMSDYNSMVLWAINGLVPDDSENGFGNNIFSNKECVIIDGLEEQLESSNVVSMVSTDLAIRGKVKLSNSAIILIEQSKYDSLSEEQKHQLLKLNIGGIKTFSGDLRQVIEQVLRDTGRYIPERPILSRRDGGFMKSDTSDELVELINRIAKERNILQMYHFDVIFNRYGNITGELANEQKNINIINEYFQKRFYKFIISKLNINGDLARDLVDYPENNFYIRQFCSEIEKYGLENYKKLVAEYNANLEDLKRNGQLKTPQQIVDAINGKMKESEDEQEEYEPHNFWDFEFRD